MGRRDILKRIDRVAAAHPEYRREAYHFVLAGLDRSSEVHGTGVHVGGRQLLAVLRDLAISRYGLMARTVLEHWGIRTTLDFGKVVFALVDSGLVKRTDDDSLDDFREVFDFEEAFERSFSWSTARG